MILVTGAGGTVGGEVVRKLLEAGAWFRAGYHSKGKAETAAAAGVSSTAFDFGKQETVRAALDGAGKVFLVSGTSPDQTAMEVGFVREAARAGVGHLVKLSVWGAESESFSFARLHRPVEKEIEASGMAWTFLRPNGFMQNLTNFFGHTIKTQGTFRLPAGEARVSHVDVRDIAAAACEVLTREGHAGKAYDLSGPEALTYARIAAMISTALGRKVTHVDVTEDDFKSGMVASGAPAWYADMVIDLTRYYKAGHAARVSPAIRQITGKEPASFDVFLREHLDAFR